MNFGQLQSIDNGLEEEINIINNENNTFSFSPLLFNNNYFLKIQIKVVIETNCLIRYNDTIIYNSKLSIGNNLITTTFMPLYSNVDNLIIEGNEIKILSIKLYKMKNLYNIIKLNESKTNLILKHIGVQGKSDTIISINGSPIKLGLNGIYEFDSKIGNNDDEYINISNIGIYSEYFHILDYRYE